MLSNNITHPWQVSSGGILYVWSFKHLALSHGGLKPV